MATGIRTRRVATTTATRVVASAASDYAERLLDSLVTAGVHDVVVCPGSRSQALALAAARMHREGRLALHVRIDERSAGFLALGIARETRAPVPIVVTSGTAVANLHPAMLEAHHADVPLVAITADRPPELHGIRANQTTRQVGLLASAARVVVEGLADDAATPEDDARRVVAAALGHRDGAATEPGPVQLDVGFRDPLSDGRRAAGAAADDTVDAATDSTDAANVGTVERPVHTIAPREGTVVIAGADAHDAAELALALGAPLVAEPSSGSRRGPNLVLPATLATELVDEVRRVVVVGHPTLSRTTVALARGADGRIDDLEVVVVGRRGLDNLVGTVVEGDLAVVGEPGDWARRWVGRWVQASRAIAASLDEPDAGAGLARGPAALALARTPVTRAMLVDAVWQHTWPHDRLVLGASRLIRVADQRVPGKAIVVHANRGLAGIDGTIATATGIAIAHDRAARGGVTRVLVGDLTLLHDVGSLLVPPDEQRPRLQIVVGDDEGGSIFDTLEVAASADPDDFARVQRTPQRVDLQALATAYGLPYAHVTDRAGLERALTAQAPALIHVALVDD